MVTGAVENFGLFTFDGVRAVWGVSSEEFTDSQATALSLSDTVWEDLTVLGIDYESIRTAAQAGDATSDEKLKYIRLRRYAVCVAADACSSAMRLAIPMKRGDGSNVYQRFSTEWDQVVKAVRRSLDEAYEALRLSMPELPGEQTLATGYEFVSKATPALDPVVGTSGNE